MRISGGVAVTAKRRWAGARWWQRCRCCRRQCPKNERHSRLRRRCPGRSSSARVPSEWPLRSGPPAAGRCCRRRKAARSRRRWNERRRRRRHSRSRSPSLRPRWCWSRRSLLLKLPGAGASGVDAPSPGASALLRIFRLFDKTWIWKIPWFSLWLLNFVAISNISQMWFFYWAANPIKIL